MTEGSNLAYNAIDGSHRYSLAELRDLKARGVDTIIRYFALGGDWKQISPAEMRDISAAGLSLSLCAEGAGATEDGFRYSPEAGAQRGVRRNPGESNADFNRRLAEQKGYDDAMRTRTEAQALGVPENSAVYFAVDFDATESQLNRTITPYFRGIQRAMAEQSTVQPPLPHLKVGVYGSGAVCRQIHNLELAERTWLAGATGWRGSRTFRDEGQWDILQHIVHEGGHEKDYDTINPLTHGIGAFNPGEAYAQAMGPGASTATPEQRRRAAQNLADWMSRSDTGDDEHDATVTEFQRQMSRALGLNPEQITEQLRNGGMLSVILIFFMSLLIGSTKMNAIGNTGNSRDATGTVIPNQPAPPIVADAMTVEIPRVTTPTAPQIDHAFAEILGDAGLTIMNQLIAHHIAVDISGPNQSPDGKFDQSDIHAMAEQMRNHHVTVTPSEVPVDVLRQYLEYSSRASTTAR